MLDLDSVNLLLHIYEDFPNSDTQYHVTVKLNIKCL